MKSILNLNMDELQIELAKQNLGSFRYKQIIDWIYKKFIFNFDWMRNISKADRDLLKKNFSILNLSIEKQTGSKDKKTEKYLFMADDGNMIESVLIKNKNRNTLCISTQAGCRLNCIFCATGKMGFKRNLDASEIVSQVLRISEKIAKTEARVSNIVFMGMGEPFLNYDNLLKAIRILNDKGLYNLGARHMTISTAGIIKGIRRFSKENIQVRLAISLNSAFQETREKIMPIAGSDRLEDMLKALKEYQNMANRKITFEYIMLNNINMNEADVLELKKALNGLKYNLNIIKYNRVNENDTLEPSPADIRNFEDNLKKNKLPYTRRKSMGEDIHAACGQLTAKNMGEDL